VRLPPPVWQGRDLLLPPAAVALEKDPRGWIIFPHMLAKGSKPLDPTFGRSSGKKKFQNKYSGICPPLERGWGETEGVEERRPSTQAPYLLGCCHLVRRWHPYGHLFVPAVVTLLCCGPFVTWQNPSKQAGSWMCANSMGMCVCGWACGIPYIRFRVLNLMQCQHYFLLDWRSLARNTSNQAPAKSRGHLVALS